MIEFDAVRPGAMGTPMQRVGNGPRHGSVFPSAPASADRIGRDGPGPDLSNVVPWRPRTSAGQFALRSAPRLFTCSLELNDGLRCLNAFTAMVTDDEGVFRRRVLQRYGARAFERSIVATGAGWSGPISDMLVSEMVADMLATAADEPDGEIARGFEVALQVGFLN